MASLKKSSAQLVAEARDRIEEIETPDLIAMLDDPDVVVVDIRDIRERQRTGFIPGSYHAPRGMLEFWVDPESPYFKEVFSESREIVLFCQSAWRSALATAALQDMGLDGVCHFESGFGGWKKSGGPTVARDK